MASTAADPSPIMPLIKRSELEGAGSADLHSGPLARRALGAVHSDQARPYYGPDDGSSVHAD